MEAKLGIMRGSQITPNMIDRAKILAKRYFDEKGYKNAEIDITQRDDPEKTNQVVLDVKIDKKEKMKVLKLFKVKDGNVEATHQECPNCPGCFLAQHPNKNNAVKRLYCGNCHHVEILKK